MGRNAIKAELEAVRRRLADLATERSTLETRLAALRDQLARDDQNDFLLIPAGPAVTNASPPAEKLALFRRLFAGRPDVFPVRWENAKSGRAGYSPACANEWVRDVCATPKVKCGECPNQKFVPVSDDIVARHLRGGDGRNGDFVAGVYPLLPDETCWFLAADFDKKEWREDASAFLLTCRERGVEACLERSRSGNGGHVWIFFVEPVPARTARQVGAAIVTETMERRPDIGFASYDRFFPNQDTMPIGGFGNLIALPLQRRAREAGNSVFVDADMKPYDDQWAFLSTLKRNSAETIAGIAHAAESTGRILGVRTPVEDEFADEPWRMPPSRRVDPAKFAGSLPKSVAVTLADEVYIQREGLPVPLIAQFVRLAAFQNPEFYRAQAMRLPIFEKPRIVSCAALHPKHLALPRGCLDEAEALARSLGIEFAVEDRRGLGQPLPDGAAFRGQLKASQKAAFADLVRHDTGVLAATTAFGKTVVAIAMIAARGRNALVLVHRRELLDQWVARLHTFLEIDPELIGVIGAGKRKPTGVVDVALIQSLARDGEVDDLVAGYGHLVVDECHHLSAVSFERVAGRAKARYVLGLSATVARKDGHHAIIFMQCGPVRHKVDARAHAAEGMVRYLVRERTTGFQLPAVLATEERPPMPAVYAALAGDDARNDVIFDDVLRAIELKRSPLVLTERKDHLEHLAGRFSRFVKNVAVLSGGLSADERKRADIALAAPETEERLVLATGRYIGEGFDDSRLDTLFLTMPISWKGTLAQYVGRLHRHHAGKTDVLVVDYVDAGVPVLARMAAKRRAGYRALGYAFEY